MDYSQFLIEILDVIMLGIPGMLAFYIYTDQTYTPMPYSYWITILAPNFDKVVFTVGFGLAMVFLHTLGSYIYNFVYELKYEGFMKKTDLEIMVMMFISYMSGWLLAKKL